MNNDESIKAFSIGLNACYGIMRPDLETHNATFGEIMTYVDLAKRKRVPLSENDCISSLYPSLVVSKEDPEL